MELRRNGDVQITEDEPGRQRGPRRGLGGSPSVSAASVIGRWVTAIRAAWASGTSAANWWWKSSCRMANSLPPDATG